MLQLRPIQVNLLEGETDSVAVFLVLLVWVWVGVALVPYYLQRFYSPPPFSCKVY